MKKLLISLLAALLILGTVFSGIACNSTDNVLGELPTLNIGDTWIVEFTYEGDSSTCTCIIEVTGEDTIDGKDCYIMEWSYTPSLFGYMENMVSYLNKTTYEWDKGQMTGTLNGEPITTVLVSSYAFPDGTYWPLEIGKEVKRIETKTSTTTYKGDTDTDTVTETITFKVEGVEDITVESGTFSCFKIVEYDEDGKKINTYWYSNAVKQNVKEIAHEDGVTTELIAYSLQ